MVVRLVYDSCTIYPNAKHLYGINRLHLIEFYNIARDLLSKAV